MTAALKPYAQPICSLADDAAALAQELNARRALSVRLVEGDLLDTAQLPALVRTAADGFGGLDILVNNASTFYPTPMGDITEMDWNDLIGTNLKAPLFLAQAAAPLLHAAGGLIINLADIHGIKPLRRYPVYSLAKAGVIMLTEVLAAELKPSGVRVNCVIPSIIDTPANRKSMPAKLLEKAVPPAQIAEVISYLCSAAASDITGTSVPVYEPK